MGFLGFNFNLRDQLVFYGSYHQKTGNQIVHFFFVPLIMWSVGVWLAYTGPISDKIDVPAHLSFLPQPLAESFEFNGAFLLLGLFGLYYTSLEPFAGLSWTLVLGLPMLGLCNAFEQHVPYAWAYAIGAHLLGWLMQIQIGHNMIEQRKPALMDSFFQGLVLAGLFAWMEGLFALGYRPKLQDELHKRISQVLADEEARQQTLLDKNSKSSASATAPVS